MSRHTPGPWFRDVYDDGSSAIVPRSGFTICVMPDRSGFPEDEHNANLIAAAPDLLAALELFLAQYHIPGVADREARPEIQAALAAISKAKGGGR